jgi:hypothetical protein
MPDMTLQHIWIYADEYGKNEFIRIAQENAWNMKPLIFDHQTIVHIGDLIKASNQHCIPESQVYRFLANQLCKKCSTEKVIDKNTGAIFFIKSFSGTINMIDLYWLEDKQEWCISITCIDQNYSFKSKKDRTIFF